MRAALIAATTEVVATDGLGSLALRRLATRLGVSPPAVHHHFANKTELVAAAAAAAFEALDTALANAEAGGGSPGDLLEEAAVAYVTFAVQRRGEFRLTYGSHVAELGLSGYPEVAGPGRRAKQRLRRAVANAFGDAVDSDSCGARFAILWGQLVGIASLVVERELGPTIGLAQAVELARQAVRSHLAGLRPVRA